MTAILGISAPLALKFPKLRLIVKLCGLAIHSNFRANEPQEFFKSVALQHF
ncbi:hypothetical protein HCU40_07140 [Pseudanabaena biceps]|nr:hypothetical protein [Pseudanabaena biceps]